MVITQHRGYCNFVMSKDMSLLPHERFISRSSLGGKLFDSIIKSGKGLAVDYEFDEMVESLFVEFPLRGWRTYLLTCLIMEISERGSKSAIFKPSKYKRKTVVFLGHCIKIIMISKEIRYENTIHDVILELDRSCLTMKWYTVSFLDHVANVIAFTYEAINLFESEFDPREAIYSEDRSMRVNSSLEELYEIMKNTSDHRMIKKVKYIDLQRKYL